MSSVSIQAPGTPIGINDICVDVLLEIFHLAVACDCPSSPHHHQQLRTVCKYWNELILRDSRFWTSFNFHLTDDPAYNSEIMQAGYTWLKRAGGYVTDVEIFVPPLKNSTP
ncbi:hypothetical protein VKT23_009896 [Stygiomarasmius scandens]|uniref:F-box domain-containing protein n=1 Tax=Marasmiellus scandens TaxID=2682957 RepID=A0ABR1JEG7_9AGAR